MLEKTFTSYLSESILKNKEIQALTDYKGESFTYGQVGNYMLRFHRFFKALEIAEGDKVALVGKSSSRWGIVYLAIVTYGAVAVPILPDFKKDTLREIILHSDTILLFADAQIMDDLKCEELKNLRGILKINDYSLHKCHSDTLTQAYDKSGLKDGMPAKEHPLSSFNFPNISNERLAVLSYTSGTTGFTKGVMLAHNSLAANIRFAQNNMPLKSGDHIVSFLPLAHTFGCAFEFLFPFTLGCRITILTKTPSPQIIMKAFQEIKPALILSVPLVIEKIYKNKLLPVINKKHIKILLKIPGLNQVILSKFRKSLSEAFGNNFHEIVMGGAPLNHEAELFFRKMKFKYTLGYGMTECGPLISYFNWSELPVGSSGKLVDTLEVKIEKESPEKARGEICVKGDNVMLGYYKNEADTRKAIDEEGWLHTGDLGYVDDRGFLFIKGRSKSMILGANGKNIFPEEIESMINNQPGIAESVVVQRNEKLVALIYPDPEVFLPASHNEEEVLTHLKRYQKIMNSKLPKYMAISAVEWHKEEFEKTPKRSIRRYLYN